MKIHKIQATSLFFAAALLILLGGLSLGLLAGISYLFPVKPAWLPGFEMLRPMHVSSALFWILLGANAAVYGALNLMRPGLISRRLLMLQFLLWLIALVGIFTSYARGRFGGREYWEFDPVWALPIALAWLIFLFQFFKIAATIRSWPVYIWMWMTGIVFFLFTFTENYLWLFPWFRERMITDMTIQWKVNGSLVGAWNQLLYGTVFFLMDRIDRSEKTGHSRMAFIMFFLGLFNLMFNWGHHIYTLPTAPYVRYTAYLVSMTEWVFFIRILRNWRKSIEQARIHYHHFSYRFVLAADFWVFVNMGQAILMSVPALNLYTHGTHSTVAHAMGTTIGINSMILLAAGFEFLKVRFSVAGMRILNVSFWGIQISLLLFWLALNMAGISKGLWQMSRERLSFPLMMDGLHVYFQVFVLAGFFLLLFFMWPLFALLKACFRTSDGAAPAADKVRNG